jgi:hypothetical protein
MRWDAASVFSFPTVKNVCLVFMLCVGDVTKIYSWDAGGGMKGTRYPRQKGK